MPSSRPAMTTTGRRRHAVRDPLDDAVRTGLRHLSSLDAAGTRERWTRCRTIESALRAALDEQLVLEALRVGEDERAPVARGDAESLGPEVERRRVADPPEDAVDHAVPRPARGRLRELEEGEDRSGRAVLVAELRCQISAGRCQTVCLWREGGADPGPLA